MKRSDKEYEKIGRLMVELVDEGRNKSNLYKNAFIKGVFSGLGSVIGATLVVALLLWLFGILGDIPLLGRVVEVIKEIVQNK